MWLDVILLSIRIWSQIPLRAYFSPAIRYVACSPMEEIKGKTGIMTDRQKDKNFSTMAKNDFPAILNMLRVHNF